MASESKVHMCECDICKTGADQATIRQHQQINLLLSRLNESQRRWYAGSLSQQLAGSSDRQLALITGLDEKTIRQGRHELESGLSDQPPDRQRRKGGGRPCAEKKTRH